MTQYLPAIVTTAAIVDSLVILIALRMAYHHSSLAARSGLLLLLMGVASMGVQAVLEPWSIRFGQLILLVGLGSVYFRRIWLTHQAIRIKNPEERIWFSEPVPRRTNHHATTTRGH